jgi:hypothetical protein
MAVSMAMLMTEGWRESSTSTRRAGAARSAFTGTSKVRWGQPVPAAPPVHRAYPELPARQARLVLRARRDHKVPQVRQALKDRKVHPERQVRRVQLVPTDRLELRERLASKDQPDRRE